MNLTFAPLLPLWLIAAIGAVLLGLLGYGSMLLRAKSISPRWVTILAGLRVVAIVLFVLLLARPVIHYTKDITDKPDMMVMLDTTRSMGRDAAGDPDPRLRDVIAAMREHGLQKKLAASFDTPWFAFDQHVRPVTPDELDALELHAETKDLSEGLRTAWAYQRLRETGRGRADSERSRLLLISDGHDDGQGDPVQTARRLGVTVYPMPPRDLTPVPPNPGVGISNFQSAPNVLLGSQARFSAKLRSIGEIDAGPVELALQTGGETVRTRRVHIQPGSDEEHVELTHQPPSAGRHDYSLVARPVEDGPAFEPHAPSSLTVNVLPRGHQVLMLEDRWRWDFRFLRRTMEDDPHFALTAFISRRPGTYMQFADTSRTVHLEGFPQGRGELAWFDTIVLGDVNPEHWPSTLAPAIHEMVVERGKSLIVLAGPGLPRLAQQSALRSLLPVEPHRDKPGLVQGPVQIAPAPGARDASLFYTPDGDDFFSVFNDLPPMDQIYAPVRKKPAANLLLTAPERTNDYGQLIVMAEHTVGEGRVLYVGTDTLWKWQMLPARDSQQRTPYEVFWKQTLRAMAPQRPQQHGAALSLRTDRSRYMPRRTVRLTAELDVPAAERGRMQVSMSVELPDERVLPAAVRAHPERAGVYLAEFEPPVPGAYTLTGRAEMEGQTVAESVTRIHVAPQAETSAPRPNDMATLSRLAQATGGRIVSPDDPATWPTADSAEARPAQVERSFDLWRTAVLLLLLVAVLSLDWLVRLWRGFV